MKIFSQSTACAFIAVANGLSFSPDADPADVMEITRSWLCNQNPESPWCRPANPRPNVRKEIQLYGGWDLPVPRYQMSVRSSGWPCSMSHLPKRGEIGKMKLVDCWSNEIQRFKDGKFIRLMNNCQSAVENNDVNRSVQEVIGEGD